MQLFVMRHGEAVNQAESDAARALTQAGHDDVLTMAQRYCDDLTSVDEIWASPYVRAQQTAALMAQHLNKPVVTQPWLTPTDNPDQVLQALREVNHTVLLVSHQPLVGTLVDSLAGLETGRYRMGTASIACVETEFIALGCAELRWLHQPN